MARERVQIFLEADDWQYIQRLATAAGMPAGALVRKWVESMVIYIQAGLGDEFNKMQAKRFLMVAEAEVATLLHRVASAQAAPNSK